QVADLEITGWLRDAGGDHEVAGWVSADLPLSVGIVAGGWEVLAQGGDPHRPAGAAFAHMAAPWPGEAPLRWLEALYVPYLDQVLAGVPELRLEVATAGGALLGVPVTPVGARRVGAYLLEQLHRGP